MITVGEAVGRGGRLGQVRSVSGSYDHEVRIPGQKSEGVTPEEFLAGAWAACFGMTLIGRARGKGLDASAAEFSASVALESANGTYTIVEATMAVECDSIEPEALAALIAESDVHCPVSKVFQTGIPKRVVESKAGSGV